MNNEKIAFENFLIKEFFIKPMDKRAFEEIIAERFDFSEKGVLTDFVKEFITPDLNFSKCIADSLVDLLAFYFADSDQEKAEDDDRLDDLFVIKFILHHLKKEEEKREIYSILRYNFIKRKVQESGVEEWNLALFPEGRKKQMSVNDFSSFDLLDNEQRKEVLELIENLSPQYRPRGFLETKLIFHFFEEDIMHLDEIAFAFKHIFHNRGDEEAKTLTDYEKTYYQNWEEKIQFFEGCVENEYKKFENYKKQGHFFNLLLNYLVGRQKRGIHPELRRILLDELRNVKANHSYWNNSKRADIKKLKEVFNFINYLYRLLVVKKNEVTIQINPTQEGEQTSLDELLEEKIFEYWIAVIKAVELESVYLIEECIEDLKEENIPASFKMICDLYHGNIEILFDKKIESLIEINELEFMTSHDAFIHGVQKNIRDFKKDEQAIYFLEVLRKTLFNREITVQNKKMHLIVTLFKHLYPEQWRLLEKAFPNQEYRAGKMIFKFLCEN